MKQLIPDDVLELVPLEDFINLVNQERETEIYESSFSGNFNSLLRLKIKKDNIWVESKYITGLYDKNGNNLLPVIEGKIKNGRK